jgi:hypothetical protein
LRISGQMPTGMRDSRRCTMQPLHNSLHTVLRALSTLNLDFHRRTPGRPNLT